jgi:hypothetical protein
MSKWLKVAAVAAALLVPTVGAEAQQGQGSNQSQDYALSHGSYGTRGGYGGAYARYYRRSHRHWR